MTLLGTAGVPALQLLPSRDSPNLLQLLYNRLNRTRHWYCWKLQWHFLSLQEFQLFYSFLPETHQTSSSSFKIDLIKLTAYILMDITVTLLGVLQEFQLLNNLLPETHQTSFSSFKLCLIKLGTAWIFLGITVALLGTVGVTFYKVPETHGHV